MEQNNDTKLIPYRFILISCEWPVSRFIAIFSQPQRLKGDVLLLPSILLTHFPQILQDISTSVKLSLAYLPNEAFIIQAVGKVGKHNAKPTNKYKTAVDHLL